MDDNKQTTNEITDNEESKALENESNPNAGSESDGLSLSGDNEIEKMAIAKALGFDRISHLSKYDDQLNTLLDYASMKGAKDISGVVAQIAELRNMLGRSSSIYEMRVYCGLELQKASIEKDIKKFQRNQA